MRMPADYSSFLDHLYHCDSCIRERLRFAVPHPSGQPRRGWDKLKRHTRTDTPYKFPPIGFGMRPLLFVGINPRFTDNAELHEQVMSSPEAFKALSENRVRGLIYITSSELLAVRPIEHFYDDQLSIAATAFPNEPFERVACSAEMYFCASADGDGLGCANSPCARRFLRPLIDEYVQPRVVITFGTSIPQFFHKHLSGIKPKVLHLPFREPWSAGSPARMNAAVNWAGLATAALLGGAPVPQRDWLWPSDNAPHAVEDYAAK